MEIIIYSITFIICLFILFMLSKQDFVLLRQNISLSQMFDALGIALISAFLFSRVLYVVNDFKTDLLSFLQFFHILKYPGLSLAGFVGGGGLCLYLIFMKRKGLGRILDIFAISFYPLFAVSIITERIKGELFYIPYIIFALSLFVFVFFIRSHQKYILRDGSISSIFILLICAQTIVNQYLAVSAKSILFSFSLLSIVSMVAVPLILIELFINQRKGKN